MRKEWVLHKPDDTQVSRLVEYLGIDPFLARLLVNRNITDEVEVNKFLNPDASLMHDPFLMKDMSTAIKTIIEAAERGNSIVIFGDYDVDGVTSTALLYLTMKKLGFNVSYYIPLRLEEGYGLSKDAITELYEQGHRLLITVDCGVTSVEEIKHAKELGFKVVVTDHHEVKESLPPAEAIVNPKRPDDEYPFKGLAGVGVAYKVLSALNETLGFPLDPQDYLDIVALGTIADIVPLKDENRYIVREGTKKIQNHPLLGLKALLSYLRLNAEHLTAQDIAFKIAPKLNAAGRMDSAIVALELLISRNHEEAMKAASRLLQHNQNRQTIEAKIFDQAIKEIEKNKAYKKDKVLVLSGENWHLGVLGIVASRLVGMYNKPVFLISTSGEVGKGSARSPSGISIISLLNNINSLLKEYGGHEMAAGLTIEKKNIPLMRKLVNEAYVELYGNELPVHVVEVDAELSLDELNSEKLGEIQLLRPFGHSNPEPKFLIKNLNIEKAKTFGNSGDHVKLILRSGDRKVLAIGFGMNRLFDEFKYVKPSLLKMDVVASIKMDNGYGLEGMKLSINDAKLYIDPVFEEEVKDKNFVFEFIRDWKNQKPDLSNFQTDVSSLVNNLEKHLSHKAPELLQMTTRKIWGVFGSIRLKHPLLAWRLLSNYHSGKRTVVISSINGTLAHTYYSLQHYLDPIKPVYANSLYKGALDAEVIFTTLPFFNENITTFKEFDEIIFDEPAYIISGIYSNHPDLEALMKNLNVVIDKSAFIGSVFTKELKDFLNSKRISYIYKPAYIKRVGIIDNRGTRKKTDQILSLVKHGENVAIIVDSPHKTISLAKVLGTKLSHTLQNGELIFYNYLLRDFQRANIYSLVERQKIKVLITTPSNDGLGVMLGNSNIVFYSAPRNFLELLDSVTARPGEDSELFLNLSFNKNDLQSNVNEIDKIFPTIEELQVIYQDIFDVLPADERDITRALSFESGLARVYLSILEEMGAVRQEEDLWYSANGKLFSSERIKKTLRYREGIAEKRMTRWFASKLSTTTTRSLLKSLGDGTEVLKIV
ncbi:single-stranded DNA exonuclease RecJ [Kosmotoga arenicorallina S304]|uniref:Single-stranded-DNA-specific exonuclease RecJ n=1 Tax=Kosmotoga arenicorallina S304 TaxID=1453497 RepID=A0A176K351_9BACT|nr:single-stranded-DNA-specific exonuclease RecJ [Kosmotoga arenicorallina]OAA31402.1 single-stranded DNA exonuclease RecJ [Kosmotoga arenicorallina S304]